MSTVSFTRLSPAPRGPSIPQMAVNLATAVGRNLQHVASGKPLHVTTDVRNARLAVCHVCPRYLQQGDAERCLHPQCGCFLRSLLLNKVELTAETCPEGRWPS